MPDQPSRSQRTTDAVISGSLLGLFCADALGARWEGSAAVRSRTGADRLERSLQEGKLAYTDDTQLALALAEHLCAHPEVRPDAFAATILDHYEHWRGYGGGMQRLVRTWRAGVPVEDAATAVFPEGSFGNGAAMRVAPVGVLWAHDRGQLIAAARRQAAVTHAHPIGIDAAAAVALAVGLAADRGAFDGGTLAEVGEAVETTELRDGLAAAASWLQRWPEDDEATLAQVADDLGNTVLAQCSAPAALWAAALAEDLPEAVQLSLGLGGDADTIAAMAGGVAGAAAGTAEAIPNRWMELLEDGERGRTYALELSRRLGGVADALRADR